MKTKFIMKGQDGVRKKPEAGARMCALLMALLLTSGCSILDSLSPVHEEALPSEEDAAQIEYNVGTTQSTSYSATLYYIYQGDNDMLLPEKRTLSFDQDRRIETVLIEELIKGPAPEQTNLLAVIDPNTKVISVTGDIGASDTLYITLSAEFLNEPPVYKEKYTDDPAELNRYRRQAVNAIVNTITELGQFSRVDIQIQDGKNTRRLINSEAGRTTNPANTLEPVTRQYDVIITPRMVVQKVFTLMRDRAWRAPLGNYLSFEGSQDNGLATSEERAYAELAAQDVQIEDFTIGDVTQSTDGKSAVVTVRQLQLRDKLGKVKYSKENVPIKLTLENGIWKIPYTRFSNILTLQ